MVWEEEGKMKYFSAHSTAGWDRLTPLIWCLMTVPTVPTGLFAVEQPRNSFSSETPSLHRVLSCFLHRFIAWQRSFNRRQSTGSGLQCLLSPVFGDTAVGFQIYQRTSIIHPRLPVPSAALCADLLLLRKACNKSQVANCIKLVKLTINRWSIKNLID